MYLREVVIENVRSIRRLRWALPEDRPSPGWHVVVGTNGAGKSTMLRAAALATIGALEAGALRQAWHEWLTRGAAFARICTAIDIIEEPRRDALRVAREFHIKADAVGSNDGHAAVLNAVVYDWTLQHPQIHARVTDRNLFSAGYGPHRRFSGGDSESARLYHSNPILARHLTLFGENVALTEATAWLKQLQYEHLESRAQGSTAPSLVELVTRFVNQDGFLPHGVRLRDVSSRGVSFTDGNGATVSADELSDGYRSVLSLTFELIRQLVLCFGAGEVFAEVEGALRVVARGVVFIDEIDAHLHAVWQRQIGFFLTAHFPFIQFIVATHSPLVCHAAVNGSVFSLPEPGHDAVGQMARGPELDRLLYGNVLEAYGTQSFGITLGARSAQGKEKSRRLAELNVKELDGGLDDDERTEQAALRSAMPTAVDGG